VGSARGLRVGESQKIRMRMRMIRMSVPIPMYIECLHFFFSPGVFGSSLLRDQTSWSVASATKAASTFR